MNEITVVSLILIVATIVFMIIVARHDWKEKHLPDGKAISPKKV